MHKVILIAAALVCASAPATALEIPVADIGQWTALSYSNIPPNDVAVADGALVISVRNSASPLVYRLEEPANIRGITVTASWSGALDIPKGARQGDEDADDFVLKVGIVEAGDKTLNWFQRRIAADWIRELYRLAPEGSGIERINFLSTTRSEALLGNSRTHPLSDLLHETRITYLEGPGDFMLSQRFPEAVEMLGLWLSSDGDNTNSSFVVRIKEITLHTN